eukprot:g1727.t1
MDPFSEYTDDQIWAVLDMCSLTSFMVLEADGGNLSVGQRQLACLGRALLRATSIMVLDEATASIDHATEEVLQATLAEQANEKQRTVITIAHRLKTIMGSDRVLVLDEGRVAEDGPPDELMQIEGGSFQMLVKKSESATKQQEGGGGGSASS